MGLIPNTNEIITFIHCANCLRDKPDDVSPGDWAKLEVGFTPIGLQVFCRKCQVNVMAIDFEGSRHPANITAHFPPDNDEKISGDTWRD